jgi:hypothetical protein
MSNKLTFMLLRAADRGSPFLFCFTAMPRKPKLLPTWEKYIARAKATRLGAVEAPDADGAIEAAAKEFKVDAKRLMAVRRVQHSNFRDLHQIPPLVFESWRRRRATPIVTSLRSLSITR